MLVQNFVVEFDFKTTEGFLERFLGNVKVSVWDYGYNNFQEGKRRFFKNIVASIHWATTNIT